MRKDPYHCSERCRCAFATAFLCMIWMLAASFFGLPGWAGFTGCTAYFAAPGKGVKSLPSTFACVGSGIAYALVSMAVSQGGNGSAAGLVMTFLTTFLMCAGSGNRILGFVPGAFMGSFSMFAAGGDLKAAAAILIGVLLGLFCDMFGKFLCSMKKE